MRIGILLCGHAPEHHIETYGDIDRYFRDLLQGRGYDFVTYPVVDMEFPDGPGDADGWIVTGSKHGVYDDLPFIPPLEALIREIAAAEVPLVGVCFGHQIVAQALGGHVEKFEGGWNLGMQDYTLGDTLGEGAIRLNAWHQDQVIRPPDGAEVIASSPTCRYAMLRYGPRMLTIQPHPEFGRDYIELLIKARAGVAPDDRVAAARARLAEPAEQARAADMMAAILTPKEPQP